MNRTAALLSIALHASVLAPLPACAPPVAAQQPSAPEREPEVLQIRLLPSDEGGEGDAACDSYRGIGVLHGWGGIITQVAPGGPADKAGARVGDRFVNDFDFGSNRYPAGTVMTMRVVRDEEPLTLRVVIGHVCHEKGER